MDGMIPPTTLDGMRITDMPFNISKAVVHRSRRYLDDMLQAKRTLTFPAHDGAKLAYQIREARYAALRHPEFAQYHPLKEWYRIRDKGTYVEAEYIGPIAPTEHQSFTQTQQTITEVNTLEQVVGACIKFSAESDEIIFPNVVLNEAELGVLYEWSKTAGWKIIWQEDAGVTMTKRKVDDIFIWRPQG